ncbi:hypothetical protein LC612_41515, partial [Nostoc sp. CHAB 5834]|nr:hypothetical protein [Nostoc sp. CHAB 5834]
MVNTRPLSSLFFQLQRIVMVAKQELFIANNFLEIPSATGTSSASMQQVATLLSNMAYYGYAPSTLSLDALRALSADELSDWWKVVEPALRAVTGDDRKMGAFVVYKNFPREVLEMSDAQYWFNQICIYIGAPYSWVAEQQKARPPLTDKLSLKTLQPAAADTLTEIARDLVTSKTRWMPFQLKQVEALARMLRPTVFDLADFGFKENGLTLMAKVVDLGVPLKIADATDVLRFAAVLSDGDVSLREKVVFRAFKRAERRFLL